jgi:hypothetical protein
LADGNQLDFKAVDLVRQRTRTRRSSSGKIKTKTKIKLLRMLEVQLLFRAKSYALDEARLAAAAQGCRCKLHQGEKRGEISLQARTGPSRSWVEPRYQELMDLITTAYRGLRPQNEKRRQP